MFCGITIRLFEAQRFASIKQWQSGCFAQDAVRDWFLCLPARAADTTPAATRSKVGIDLGLKDIAGTSDEERLQAGRFYRNLEETIAQAQGREHCRQAQRLHRQAARRRSDTLHKFSRSLVNRYQTIILGDVSSQKLAKTQMAKSVFDCGWGMLKTQISYKGQWAGRCVLIVNETNTTRTCPSCGSLTGPVSGVNGLRGRSWMNVQ